MCFLRLYFRRCFRCNRLFFHFFLFCAADLCAHFFKSGIAVGLLSGRAFLGDADQTGLSAKAEDALGRLLEHFHIDFIDGKFEVFQRKLNSFIYAVPPLFRIVHGYFFPFFLLFFSPLISSRIFLNLRLKKIWMTWLKNQ